MTHMAATAEGNALSADEKERMHGSKRRFPTFEAAVGFAQNQCRRTGVFGRPYRCPVCAGYHLTTRGQVLPQSVELR